MMYKKQMTAQKVICLLSIIASVITFVYALGLMTDLYDSLHSASTIEKMAQKKAHPEIKTSKGEEYPPSGFGLYDDMQPFNRTYLVVSIGLILVSCGLFITNTAVRRRYYIGNYMAVGIHAAANFAAAGWVHWNIVGFKAQYMQIDFATLEQALRIKKLLGADEAFAPNTFCFDVHYFVFGLTILTSVLLILNVIWKCDLMKAEKQLLNESKEVLA